jgi:hypothetical protein
MKDWLADRRDAKKHGEKFNEPRPRPPIVKKIGKTYKEKEDAEDFREKIEKLWDKKMAARKKKKHPDDEFTDDEEEKPKKRRKKKDDKEDDDDEKKDDDKKKKKK